MEGGKKLSQKGKEAVMNGVPLDQVEGAYEDTGVKEEIKEEPKQEESVKDEKSSDKTTEKENTEKQVKDEPKEFDLSVFETKFGRKIESEDALKSLFDKADKYDGTNQSYLDAVEKLKNYEGLEEKLDPLSNFLNEDEYKRQQLLIKNKDKLTEDAIKALSVLTPNKIKEMSDENALTAQLMVDKGLTEREAKLYLMRKYDIEDFGDELDEGVKTAIKVDAIDARRDISKLYDGIDVPTKVDYETARTQLKQSWEVALPDLIKSIDKIKLSEDIDFAVTDEMKKDLAESTLQWLVSKQIKPSEEAGAQVMGRLNDQILTKNINKVVKSIESDLREKLKAETRKDIHNDKPLEEGSRAAEQQVDNDAKMSKLLR